MTAAEVISEMGRTRYVERIVGSFMHAPRLTPSLQDLAQIIYEAILRTDAAKLVKLWDATDGKGQRQMDFYIVGICRKQTESSGTCWRSTYQDYGRRALPINEDIAGGEL